MTTTLCFIAVNGEEHIKLIQTMLPPMAGERVLVRSDDLRIMDRSLLVMSSWYDAPSNQTYATLEPLETQMTTRLPQALGLLRRPQALLSGIRQQKAA